MRMRILLSILLALTAAMTSTSYAIDGTTYDEQWVYHGIPAGTYSGYVKEVAPETRFLPDSVLMNFAAGTVVGAGYPDRLCKSLIDSDCEFSQMQLYYAVLPPCVLDTDTDCLSQISATVDGKVLNIVPRGKFPTESTQSFLGNPNLNLPTGATSTLVEIPDAPHPGGDLYLVKAQMEGFRWANSLSTKFQPPDFNVEIFAVALMDGSYTETLVSTKATMGGQLGNAPWKNDPRAQGCVAHSTTQCAVPYPLPENVSFGLQFRLLNKPVSWLQGRFKDPAITVGVDSFGNTILDVAAQAIKVPVLAVALRKDQIQPAMYGQVFPGASSSAGPTDQNSSQFDLSRFLAWLSASDNRAVVQPSSWEFRSTIANYGQYDSRTLKCFGSTNDAYLGTAAEFRGLVTTNASQYIEGPPTFNDQDQTLDYKVAAPHYTPSGDIFRGTYNLVISSKFARCIYGFSKAPVQATISVTSETGEKDVATTVVGEKDGLFYMAAYGFTFSSPIIKVKMTQAAAVVTPTPTTTPTASTRMSPAPHKQPVATLKPKLTITCIKGKAVKKILGLKPECPRGFRKKSKP